MFPENDLPSPWPVIIFLVILIIVGSIHV